jgi:hypothetical protein
MRHLSQEVVPAYTRAFTALREVPNGFNHLVQQPLKASVVIGTLVPYDLNF